MLTITGWFAAVAKPVGSVRSDSAIDGVTTRSGSLIAGLIGQKVHTWLSAVFADLWWALLTLSPISCIMTGPRTHFFMNVGATEAAITKK